MPYQLLVTFVNVVAPVFAVTALGYVVGPRLGLDARTLARLSYHVLIPAFAFHVISGSRLPLARTVHFAACIAVLLLAFAVLGWAMARALRRSREVSAAYIMLSVFANTGNFGLALCQFRFGEEALTLATLFWVVSLLVSFFICVGAAEWARGGRPSAVLSVLRTPAIGVAVVAMIVSTAGWHLPPVVTRTVKRVADATIPTMLFGLGLQLAAEKKHRVNADVLVVSAFRLVVAPVVAVALIPLFGIGALDRSVAIVQSAMPVAVIVGVISAEYQIAPAFVMTSVLVSTVLSIPALTILLSLL